MSFYGASSRRGRLRKKGAHWPHASIPAMDGAQQGYIAMSNRQSPEVKRAQQGRVETWLLSCGCLSSSAECDVITPTLGVGMIEYGMAKALGTERNQVLRHRCRSCFPHSCLRPLKIVPLLKSPQIT